MRKVVWVFVLLAALAWLAYAEESSTSITLRNGFDSSVNFDLATGDYFYTNNFTKQTLSGRGKIRFKFGRFVTVTDNSNGRAVKLRLDIWEREAEARVIERICFELDGTPFCYFTVFDEFARQPVRLDD